MVEALLAQGGHAHSQRKCGTGFQPCHHTRRHPKSVPCPEAPRAHATPAGPCAHGSPPAREVRPLRAPQDSSPPHGHFSGPHPEPEGRGWVQGPAFHSGVSGYSAQAQCQPGKGLSTHPRPHASPGLRLCHPWNTLPSQDSYPDVCPAAPGPPGGHGMPVTVGFCPGSR